MLSRRSLRRWADRLQPGAPESSATEASQPFGSRSRSHLLQHQMERFRIVAGDLVTSRADETAQVAPQVGAICVQGPDIHLPAAGTDGLDQIDVLLEGGKNQLGFQVEHVRPRRDGARLFAQPPKL